MTACSDIGEEDADLAVLHASAHAAILWSDASGVCAAFGKAAFIQHQDGEECFGVSVRRPNGRLQGLDEEATQLITHAVLVPDGFGEQALDAIRVQAPGVFSDLPAIFPGNLAEDGLAPPAPGHGGVVRDGRSRTPRAGAGGARPAARC